MKILAIRVNNLASIAGSYVVDLEKPPLGHAGIFVITGATGAGKSTLLDALCVALFDKTPRFEGGGRGVLVGRADDDLKARLDSNDVRALLRRGAGFGSAEVDYLGRDGRRYRAQWSVHRAREKADGAYQTQRMSLVEISTGQALGGALRTEVLAEIVRTLGLSYNQFRRSALLAQGDFAAFLKATGKERASLLEQMTGTSIYRKLSIETHKVYKKAQDDCEDLKARRGTVQVIAPELRSALEIELRRFEMDKQDAVEKKTRIEGAVRWFDTLKDFDRQGIECARSSAESREGTRGGGPAARGIRVRRGGRRIPASARRG